MHIISSFAVGQDRVLWLAMQPVISRFGLLFAACLFFIPPGVVGLAQSTNSASSTEASRYEIRREHDPDGIGKFYLGREIAHVMGHQAADWLERPERQDEERPDLLLEALKVKAGDAVADIGAGTGFYTRRLAKLVGSRGVVYGVDIQPEMLELLTNKMAELNLLGAALVWSTVVVALWPPTLQGNTAVSGLDN